MNTQHTHVDLLPVIAELARRAWAHVKTVAKRIYDLVKPPPDLRVSSTEGHEYSGFIVVEHNEVEGGAVARVGHDTSRANGPYGGGPLVTPPSRHHEYDSSSYLRSWAEDPRSEEEDLSWRYR